MKIRVTVRLSVLVCMTSLFPSWGADVGTTGAWIVERKSEGEPMRTGQVFPGSPAEKAGIKPDWFLIAIDGTNVVKTPSKEILGIIRGSPGKSVKLELADPTRSKTNTFIVRRGKAVIVNGSVVKITDD